MNRRKECYEVGALLYMPALNQNAAASVLSGKINGRYSVALCLEDAVADAAVWQAQQQLLKTLQALRQARESGRELPKLFIRVREPAQLAWLTGHLALMEGLVTGFIFPKYSLVNAEAYNECMRKLNRQSAASYAMMPILESEDIIGLAGRRQTLLRIKEKIDEVQSYVLNVRVGGNDFCNQFAVRRHCNETIYEILPVAGILADILTVFAREYVVSGPVWEFFSGEGQAWADGLRRELKLDLLNGFVGKTVIHPNQIPIVNEALKVSRSDYEDAKAILEWDQKNGLGVAKGAGGERMNEVKTHENWAGRTLLLAEIYGVEETVEAVG